MRNNHSKFPVPRSSILHSDRSWRAWLLVTAACAAPVGTRGHQVASFYKSQPLAVVGQPTLSATAAKPGSGERAGKTAGRKLLTPRPPAAAEPSVPAQTYALQWPIDGQITSRFGQRSGRPHDGIDIGAPQGTPVKAAASGLVLYSAPHGSYGNLVVLKHDSGLVTVYAHNDRNLVRKGQEVTAGQAVGKVGQTGRATGPHLHFEVRRGTRPENPLAFLPP